ncbi:MAG TPA: aminoglycoside phosphotransferase family protein [Pseudonocardiaceae bacterium]|nr:aminoglycoside phosphotransferase family protein [Pseudonocardiaceae bacterium]
MSQQQEPVRDGLDRVFAAAGYPPGGVEACTRLGDANYNTAYRVRLADGTGLVLKIAPDPTAPALAYERDIMRTEELFYRTAAQVAPVPTVVCADFSREVIGNDYLLMTELPGANWATQLDRITGADRDRLRTELGAVTAALHRVTGPSFGYPQDEPFPTWRAAFTGMLDALFADAARFEVPLPEPVGRIRAATARHLHLLDDVTTPVLVHFDLWAGNILVHDGALTGVVDGERAFWGDPLAELASVALFGDVEQDPAFVAGYRSAGGRLVFDDRTRRRLALYQAYLYLIMLVEWVPRGSSGPMHELTIARAAQHLRLALDVLT